MMQKCELYPNVIFATMYRLIRQIFFLIDAERAHYIAMKLLKVFCSISLFRKWLHSLTRSVNLSLAKDVWGLRFRHPVGLGAGFDKNALYLRELEVLDFSFVEIGTVTPLPQSGNPKPRIFRLPKDSALINRMGFNNDGVDVVARRLKAWRKRESAMGNKQSEINSTMFIGGNIGKNKDTPNEEAWKDYVKCFIGLHRYVDFFVVNVSSPNTPGLRALQEKESLSMIVTRLQFLNTHLNIKKPILLKLAPDLELEAINDVIALAGELNLDGLVITNTTTSRETISTNKKEVEKMGAGGLSGKPLKNKSTSMIQYIYSEAGSIPIIGSGGIFTAKDAKEKMDVGASLIEVWTAFIYEGPFIVKKICRHLSK
jgi:dihydroorotate dehydrogenase